MIVCASRRTDIPAFHSEWFMNRLRSGNVLVRNPVQRDVVYDVSLKRRDVDCIVFLSKDPRPMEKYLDEILEMGHQVLFQITIDPYGQDIEPNVPDMDTVADSFVRISERIGSDRMLWRYDPVIFSERFDIEYHKKNFEHICRRLEGSVSRCTFSFLSYYDKLSSVYGKGILRPATDEERKVFLDEIPDIAGRYGMRMSSCCIGEDTGPKVVRCGCLDSGTLKHLGIPFDEQYEPVRENCLCVKSIDIGSYDTCRHDCLYCYANSKDPSSRSRTEFDDGAEMLMGCLKESDRVVKIGRRVNARLSDYNLYV